MGKGSNTDQNGIRIMDVIIADQATAVTALRTARDNLFDALDKSDDAMEVLRDLIVLVRPSGLLTVDEMAEAIGRDRNYVDSVWSNFGDTNKGKQTRVASAEADETDIETARHNLRKAADQQRERASVVSVLRAERDRVVAMVYASKLLGPSSIASEVQVDRNHVLRIARRAGVAPAHRQGSRNQYSPQA